MSRRNLVLADGEIYHIFNRSVGKTKIFVGMRNLKRVIRLCEYYRFPQKIRFSKFRSLKKEVKEAYFQSYKKLTPLVEIYAFAFMPNHYHILLKQIKTRGILRFISTLQNSFAKAFNLVNDRSGTLFQTSFKAKRVETDEEFTHVSRYIHLNPVTSYLIEFRDLDNYPWTSFTDYRNSMNSFLNTQLLLDIFGSINKYEKFVKDQVGYQQQLDLIKHIVIEK